VWTKMREFKRVVAELQTNAHLLYKYSEWLPKCGEDAPGKADKEGKVKRGSLPEWVLSPLQIDSPALQLTMHIKKLQTNGNRREGESREGSELGHKGPVHGGMTVWRVSYSPGGEFQNV
jgi:hypothetical protein